MYSAFHELLADRKGGATFTCFGVWHLLYLLVIGGAIAGVVILLRRKGENARERTIRGTIALAFGLYVADFFLMPFAYGEIDVEKLPFHVCTAMCVMSFWSRHWAPLSKYTGTFARLGLISNLIYVIYPAGVGWYAIHPLSYRVWQTLLFHGIMTAYGLLVLIYEPPSRPQKRGWRREILICALVVLWALLGNTLYNGAWEDTTRLYNWSFVVRDPFYLLPANVAPFVMPFVMLLLLFGLDMLMCALCRGAARLSKHKKKQ